MTCMASVEAVRSALNQKYPHLLVDELLMAYQESKRNLYLGGLRLSGVEGGRYCEAAFRLLQHSTTGTYTPIGTHLDTEVVIRTLSQIPQGKAPDSVRLHIPRALRMVYDLRNKRNLAHLGDGIDPNLQDATLVASALDWVLAELLRLSQGASPGEAQGLVNDIVTRSAPAVQDFNGFLKVLHPKLNASDFVLLLLYQCGNEGADFKQLESWVRPSMRLNLRRTLAHLVDDKAHVHHGTSKYVITALGMREVEQRRLYELPC